jgi:hypothetical protein
MWGSGPTTATLFLIGDEAARGVFDVLLPIMSSLLINSYSEAYPDVDQGFYIRKRARLLVNDMAARCPGELKTLFSALEGALLPGPGIFAHDPAEGPLDIAWSRTRRWARSPCP